MAYQSKLTGKEIDERLEQVGSLLAKHLQYISDITEIYESVDGLPTEATNGYTVIVKTNGGTPLMIYSYSATEGWGYKYNVQSQTLYLDLVTNNLYRYTMSPPYFLPVNQQPHLYSHDIYYEEQGHTCRFSMYSSSPNAYTQVSELRALCKIDEDTATQFRYLATGVYDNSSIICVLITESWVCSLYLDGSDVCEADFNETITLNDTVTQIF